MKLTVSGINTVRAKGRTYYYHRKTGARIRSAPDTAAFLAEVEALDGRGDAEPTGGSLGALITAYRASPEFLTQLAAETRVDYQKVFDYLKPMRDMPLLSLDAPLVIGIRDKAFAKRKRWFANYCVKVIRLLCTWGKPHGFVATNPAMDVPLLKKPKDAPVVNRAWTIEEVRAVLAAAPSWMLAPIALALFLGMRITDALRVPWTAYDGVTITWRQSKTGGDPIKAPVHKVLRAILEAERERQRKLASERAKKGRIATEANTIVQGMRGRPFTRSGFRASFTKLLADLRKEGQVGAGLTFHGGRHTVATLLAEAGANEATIIGLTGHANEAGVRPYVKRAQRQAAARQAVALLEQVVDENCKTLATGLQNSSGARG